MNRAFGASISRISLVLFLLAIAAVLLTRTRKVPSSPGEAVPLPMSGNQSASGVVVDQARDPVPEAVLQVCPVGRGTEVTDSRGHFVVRWPSCNNEYPALLMGRHVGRGLAGVLQVEDGREEVRLQLLPGVRLRGRVKDEEGTPIVGARASLTAWGGRMGARLSDVEETTGTDGVFELFPLPLSGKFSLNVKAKRYGRGDWQFHCEEAEGDVLTAPDVVLRRADLSLSGVVVDQEESPVSDVHISMYGAGQPYLTATTDGKGLFLLEGVCSGKITVRAYMKDGRNGSVRTLGGATDLGIVLGNTRRVKPAVLPEPVSLKGRRVPGIGALGLRGLSQSIGGKRLLLCFWNRDQRPSRQASRELTRLHVRLLARDIVVAGVELGAEDSEAGAPAPPFRVGRAEATEEALNAWGIRGLPWLILVGEDRKVIVDGLGLGEVKQLAEVNI